MDQIIPVLKKNGALGVNALSKETNIPVSTLHKYLHKQTYFIINEDRKWELPETVQAEVKATTFSLLADVAEVSTRVLQSQLEEALLSINNVLNPINSLKRGLNSQSPSVADITPNIDQRLIDLDMEYKDNMALLRQNKSKMPEEYRDVITNMDFLGIILTYGFIYVKGPFFNAISELIIGESDSLEEEILKIIMSNQKS